MDWLWTTADEHPGDQDGRSSWSAPAEVPSSLMSPGPLAAAGWLTTLVVTGGDRRTADRGPRRAGPGAGRRVRHPGAATASSGAGRPHRPAADLDPARAWARVGDVGMLRTLLRPSRAAGLDLRVDGGERAW
ncbi:hypothetical protein HBB16_21380 [Pseudonocardia sp. MCCB 268]|nr:hypothetical protein [Pseudonocardia cytotoxica]